MSIGGAGNNRPVNTGATLPTAGAGQAKEPGMEFVQDLVLGGKVHTAQAQPAGKSFTETMGAAFTAMGAAVTNFFKGLGDRMASIELPQLPRISLRQQEAVQAEAAAPQRPADPFEAAMGGKPVSAKVRADITAFAQFASNTTQTSQIVEHLIALPRANAAAMAYESLQDKTQNNANLNFVRGIQGEGMPLGEFIDTYVKPGADSQLNLSATQQNNILDCYKAMKSSESGISTDNLLVRFDSSRGIDILNPGSAVDADGDPDGIEDDIPFNPDNPEEFNEFGFNEKQQGLVDKMQGLAQGVRTHAIREMSNQVTQEDRGGLVVTRATTYPEQKLFQAGMAALAEGVGAVGKGAANDQAEIGKLNAMSTQEFATALRVDPILARHLPQMNPSSPARQEYENFVASQPPMSRQAATEGFYQMVKESAIIESLREGGLIDDDPLDDVEAESDSSNIPGIGLPGPVSTGTPSGLPQVELNSLAHLFNLPQGKDMAGLQANLVKEFCGENMDALTTGAALFKFEDSAGLEAAPDFSNYSSVSRSLSADLPIVQQWADNFVKAGARQEINLAGDMQDRVLSALGNVSGSGVLTTESQRTELTEAIATFLFQTVAIVNTGQSSSYLKP